jgi:hypothetical protein
LITIEVVGRFKIALLFERMLLTAIPVPVEFEPATNDDCTLPG